MTTNFNPKLPRTLDYIVMQMRKINGEKGYYEKMKQVSNCNEICRAVLYKALHFIDWFMYVLRLHDYLRI